MNRFIDPVAQVIVKNPDSGKEWNWTFPDYPFLTSLNIDIERGMRHSAMSFGIDAPYTYKILDELISENSPFKFGNLVRGRIGYASGDWTPWYSGFIQDGGVNLTIDANGISGTIDVQALPGRVAAGNIPIEIIQQAKGDMVTMMDLCCRKMKISLDISSKASERLNENKGILETGYDGVNRMVGFVSMSMWDLMKKICEDSQCQFWTTNDTNSEGNPTGIVLKTNDEAENTPSVRTYMIRGIIDEDNNVFPCLSFGPEGGGLAWKANDPVPSGGGIIAASIDKEIGEVLSIEIPPEIQETPIFGSLVYQTPEDTELDGNVNDAASSKRKFNDYVSFPVAPSGKEILKRMALGYQEQGNPAQNGVITTLGIPGESTLNACKLKGAGWLFDGTYIIEKMTHAYSPGSWDMTLNVRRFGSNGVTGQKLETLGGQLK